MPRFARFLDRSVQRLLAGAACAILASGCMSPPPIDEADEQRFRDAVELSAQLLAIADIASSAFTDRVAQLRVEGTSDLIAYTAETIRNNAVANYRSIALSPDPANGLVNMYIFSKLGLWGCENRILTHPDLFDEDCDGTYGLVQRRVDALARQWMTSTQIDDLDRRIDEFKQRHPGRVMIGSVRLEDLTRQIARFEERTDQVAPSLFSPVSEAAQQLEQVRLLGDRAIWLLSRMPETLSWRASAFLMEILSSDGFVAIKELASSISERLKLVHESVQSLDDSMDTLGDNVSTGAVALQELQGEIGSLGGRMASLDGSLDAMSERLDGTSDSLAALPDRIASLEATLGTMNASLAGNIDGLGTLAEAGERLDAKIALLDARIEGLGTSVASLTEEIETLEGAKSIIDESLLKAAGLGALLIVFAGVSRYAVHHLTKAK